MALELEQARLLVEAVRQLSLAKNLDDIATIVKTKAREMEAAQGATFVLRDGNQSYYLDEDAIAPLWKGQRFHMSACIAGWTILNRSPAVIPDINCDERVPAEAYRRTFVRSLVMVPIRSENPMGAIGIYWNQLHDPREAEVNSLQALADATSVAMENLALLRASEARISELQQANQAKDQFLRIISHELRTPLNGILGWAQVLKGELRLKGTAAHLDNGLDAIERSGRSLARLVDDLLDLARARSGKLPLRYGLVSLNEIVAAVTAQLSAISRNKNVLVAEFRPNTELMVEGDADRLHQLLHNLISNAVKFTESGGHVEIHLARTGPHATVRVVDTGPGIAPEILPHLFEPFYQGDGTTTRPHDGAGIGLSIAQAIAMAHGGSLTAANSDTGRGAEFTLRLPAWTAATRPAKPAAAGREALPLQGISVLAVDDQADARLLVSIVLELRGAAVLTAENTAEAWNLLHAHRPQVLVCDLSMPGEDGFSFIRRVRAGAPDEHRRLLAIALTAFSDEDNRSYAEKCGFDTVIGKPLDAEVLTRVITEGAPQRH